MANEIPKSTSVPYFIIDREVSHANQAKANNIQQFKGRENIEKLIDILLSQLQKQQADVLKAQKGLSIEQGTGWMLDLVGKSLQSYRESGQSDEDFRKDIVEKIVFDNSQGSTKDLLACATFMVDADTPISVVDAFPASVVFDFPLESLVTDRVPNERLQSATAAGVKSHIYVYPRAETAASFDMIDGGGFSSTDTADNNGSIGAIYEERPDTLAPFGLDGPSFAGSKGLGSVDYPSDPSTGMLVSVSTFVDTNGDTIPDSYNTGCIKAIDYTI